MNDIIIREDGAGRDAAIKRIQGLAGGRPWRVSIKPYKSNRTLEQNRLYHMWVGIVADETGNKPEDVHEWAKDQLLPKRVVEINDKVLEVRSSTTELNTKEMSEYMERFRAEVAIAMGIDLPSPELMGI